jgi:sulfonate transport system substrate-binding protein
MAAKDSGLSIEQIEKLAQYYDFSPEFSATDIENLERTQKFLLNNKMIVKPIDIKKMITQ